MKKVLIMVFLATGINVDQCGATLPTKEEMEEFVTIIGFSKQADALGDDGSIDITDIKLKEPKVGCSLCPWLLRASKVDKPTKKVTKLVVNGHAEIKAELSRVGLDIYTKLTSSDPQERTEAWSRFMQAPEIMDEVCEEARKERAEAMNAKGKAEKKRAWDMYVRVVGCKQLQPKKADKGKTKA